jgi:hypothetical protein
MSFCNSIILEGPNKGHKCKRKAGESGVCEKHLLKPRCLYIHVYGDHKGLSCSRVQSHGNYCISHKQYNNGQCDAIIETGEMRGERCFRPCENSSSFCGKHIKIKVLNEIKTSNQFKCYTHRCLNKVKEDKTYCEECALKKAQKKLCKAIIHQGERKGLTCLNETNDDYCLKHSDLCYLHEYANITNQNICGNGLRCRNLIPRDKKFCEQCVNHRRQKDNYDKKAKDTTRCIDCGKSNVIFYNNSRYCEPCYKKMRKVEDKRNRKCALEGFINPDGYYNRYKYDANRRNIDFHLSLQEFITIVSQKCNYCGLYNESQFNGIDREDNNVGYIVDNCVSACSNCNLMKSNYEVSKFMEHIHAISEYQKSGCVKSGRILQKGNNKTTYLNYKKKVETKRKLTFRLDEEQYNTLKASPCYICGIESSENSLNGIDRIDSTQGYTEDNCAPCCIICNKMKLDTSYEEFINHVLKISEYRRVPK